MESRSPIGPLSSPQIIWLISDKDVRSPTQVSAVEVAPPPGGFLPSPFVAYFGEEHQLAASPVLRLRLGESAKDGAVYAAKDAQVSAQVFQEKLPQNVAQLSMVDYHEEDFCFILGKEDIIACPSNMRMRLKNHPEPPRRINGSSHETNDRSTSGAQPRAPAARRPHPAKGEAKEASARRRDSGAAKAPPGQLRALAALSDPGITVEAHWIVEGSVLEADNSPRWHASSQQAGRLSQDGHIFTKLTTGPPKRIRGVTLASLCILFEERLRRGGIHCYRYCIIKGSVGSADGVGFVFDSKIRRTNIQHMKSIFLNSHGQVCLRDHDRISKLPVFLPKLAKGVTISLTIDLDQAWARFEMEDPQGNHSNTNNLSFATLASGSPKSGTPPSTQGLIMSGFFCAIVTNNIEVSLC